MKLKELLLPMSVALLTTWLIQYMFFPKQVDNATTITDRSFIAPTSTQSIEPLDLDIDFFDAKPNRDKQITNINTAYGTLSFSNNGAIIEFMAYKRMLAGKEGLIETLVPSPSNESGAFLVALNGLGNTPYYYDLIENKTEKDITTVTYKGESNSAIITKQFIINNNIYKIDLNLTIEPKDKNLNLRARILFPAPLVVDPSIADNVMAVLYSEKQAIEKKPLKDVIQLGKENPSIFGLEDHYFINALIGDPQKFAKRAYYKLDNSSSSASAVLQSLPIEQKSTWELSFYCGPKEASSLAKVDKKLEDVLDYGWLAFISRPLLYLLNFIYGIFHNYGVAIIILTILIRLIMLPFTLKGEESRRKHVEAQKKLQYIEQKYKHDPELLAREKAEFAKKHGLPGTLGCLSLFLQIPIFIGLNRVLSNAIELYKAPFFGWIHDLSARDPYYVLPVLVGISMLMQTSQSGDPRQKVANILIAIIIAAVTSNLSAGLVLFICVSNFLGVLQTYLQKAIKA